jgi:hypothetical protein
MRMLAAENRTRRMLAYITIRHRYHPWAAGVAIQRSHKVSVAPCLDDVKERWIKQLLALVFVLLFDFLGSHNRELKFRKEPLKQPLLVGVSPCLPLDSG